MLLETEYKNVRTKMRYKCPDHPDKELSIPYNDLRNGAGCMYCGIERRDAMRRMPYEDVNKMFTERGYKLLEKRYKNAHTPLRFLCPKHPDKDTKLSLKELQRGTRCRYCYLDRNKGETHTNYNPNLTDEERMYRRRHSGYIEWRRKVFEKDNYTCVKCGDSTGGNLNAHHKDGFNWCKERRLDVTNGATLCETCHADFHRVYGYGGNTEDQFDEWEASDCRK